VHGGHIAKDELDTDSRILNTLIRVYREYKITENIKYIDQIFLYVCKQTHAFYHYVFSFSLAGRTTIKINI